MTSFARHPAIRHAWHAVARSVDVAAPMAVRLCGEDLVVWRGGDGEVAAAADRCPHRQAPLSNGVVTDGVLECPYHGWSFDTTGRCVLLPSSGPGAPVPPRARLACLSVQERYGLVWVALEQPTSPLPEIAQDADPAFRRIVEPVDQWHVAATRAVDNFCDVAHFSWVHIGTFGAAGDRKVAPISLTDLDDFHGWSYEVMASNEGVGAITSGQSAGVIERKMTTGFSLPFLVRSTIEYPATGLQHIILLVTTPVDDDYSLFTFVVWRNDDRTVSDHEVVALDRAIGAEDKRMLETLRGTLPLDATTLVNTQADRASVEWRRRLRLLMDSVVES